MGVWCPLNSQHCRLLPTAVTVPSTDGTHTSRCGDGAWESGRNPNFSPSSSTSSIISCSSSGVGFCPSILITFPSSLVLMHPSSAPSTKMSKAALNSGERGERRCEGPQPCRQGLIPGTASPDCAPQQCPGRVWGDTRHITETALLEMLVDQNPWVMACLGQAGLSTFQVLLLRQAGLLAGELSFRLWWQVEDAPTIFLLFCQLLNL